MSRQQTLPLVVASGARRAFVNRENLVLGRFLDVSPDVAKVLGWSRSYRCECGFACRAPGDIFDHTQRCGGAS